MSSRHTLSRYRAWWIWRRRNLGPLRVPALRSVQVTQLPIRVPIFGIQDPHAPGAWLIFPEPVVPIWFADHPSDPDVIEFGADDWSMVFHRGDVVLVHSTAGLRPPAIPRDPPAKKDPWLEGDRTIIAMVTSKVAGITLAIVGSIFHWWG